eukprot:4486117-Pleurochrysis_carterae.AAC.1
MEWDGEEVAYTGGPRSGSAHAIDPVSLAMGEEGSAAWSGRAHFTDAVKLLLALASEIKRIGNNGQGSAYSLSLSED